jgi:hypothetical protein
MGPPDYAMHETHKSGLDREPPKFNLSKRCWGFHSPPPPGECYVREGGRYQPGACVGAVSGGAACVRAIFDAVDTKEMVHALDSVQVEL